jgi:hypothetical protein
MKNKAFLDLEKIKKDLMSGKTKDIFVFINRVMKAIDKHEWVYFPTHRKSCIVYDDHGKHFLVLYSGKDSEKVAPDLTCLDINKVIDILYEDKNLSGIVFDSGDTPIFISRGQINAMSHRKDPRLVKRKYAPGIPEYTDDDLLTRDEIFDFGINVIIDELEKDGFHVEDVVNNFRAYPNIFATKNKQTYFIYVISTIALEEIKIDKKILDDIKNDAKEAIPMIARVSFASVDEERFNHKLALVGDNFHCKYEGLEKIN